MRIISSVFFLLFIISCNKKEDHQSIEKIPVHNPQEHIALTFHDKNAEILYELGKSSYSKNNIDSSFIYFNESLKLEENAIVYNEMGIVKRSIQDLHSADEYFKRAVNIDSTYWPAQINYASNNILLNRDEEAKEILSAIIQNSDSSYWKAYANLYLAVVYSKNPKDCKTALKCLEQTHELHNDPEIKNKLVNLENKVQHLCN